MHLSEGFGQGMAEALQLGVDVIATDDGGNTSCCTGPLAHPVRCQEVPIPRGADPCADGYHGVGATGRGWRSCGGQWQELAGRLKWNAESPV